MSNFFRTVILPKISWRYISVFLGLVILIGIFSNLSSILHQTIAPKGIVFSKDNDAGRGIQTAILSAWYKSNHFAPYGNLNYRVAHTLATLTPTKVDNVFGPSEKNETIHHYALLITNLFSLTTLCFFLSFLLLGQWDFALMLTSVLLNLSILNPAWVEFIFRVHPDHMLMLFVTIACYMTMKYSKENSNEYFIKAALMWGIATAVKRSTILFIPSFIFLFLIDGLSKENFIKGLKFAGFMLLSYLIIGFPQNFGFIKHIRFLLDESHNSLPADWASIKLYSLETFNQFKWIALTMIPIHIFFGRQEKLWSSKFFGFTLIALFVYLSRQMTSYQHHHPMSYAALMIIFIYALIKSLPVIHFKYKSPIFTVAILLYLWALPTDYSVFSQEYDHQMLCQPQALDMLKKIKGLQKQGNRILLREPYFPLDSDKDLDRSAWGVTFQDIDTTDASLIGIKEGFGSLYLSSPPAHYRDELKMDWKDKEQFYSSIKNRDAFTTPSGKEFKINSKDNCGFILWEKIN